MNYRSLTALLLLAFIPLKFAAAADGAYLNVETYIANGHNSNIDLYEHSMCHENELNLVIPIDLAFSVTTEGNSKCILLGQPKPVSNAAYAEPVQLDVELEQGACTFTFVSKSTGKSAGSIKFTCEPS